VTDEQTSPHDATGDPLASPQEALPPAAPVLRAATPGQQRLTAVAEIVLCSSLPTQVVLGALLVQFGLAPTVQGGGLSLPFVFTVSILDTALLIVLMTLFTRAHGDSVSELWLGPRRPAPERGSDQPFLAFDAPPLEIGSGGDGAHHRGPLVRPIVREALLGLSLVPVVFMLVVVLLLAVRAAAPVLHNVPSNPLEEMARGGAINAAAFGVIAIVAGGIREELQRAFLLRRFERHLGGGTVGVIVTSIAFGLGHAVQGWDAAVTTGALGAFWAVLYQHRRSSVAPMVSHAGFNSMEVLRVALGV
jgi:membrane protease YdiL (CAAX protease family)